jgi:hypothetical protein
MRATTRLALAATLVALVTACDGTLVTDPRPSTESRRAEVVLCVPSGETIQCSPADSTPAPRDSTYVCYLFYDAATGVYWEWCGWI